MERWRDGEAQVKHSDYAGPLQVRQVESQAKVRERAYGDRRRRKQGRSDQSRSPHRCLLGV